ncbi:MAG: alpha-L-fucosidase [Asticcacaulis sp.]|uniref:alpha-L-fucosidase n=1 Tax=Asticcacaulis sp. TaxID=1872648 RepID=UPI0039E273F0
MTLNRRQLLTSGTGLAITATPAMSAPAKETGFTPDWKSLVENYQVPTWFRDAKFGIWAHWSAQCVPEQGDWYARRMYLQGEPAYDHHLKTYGHPADSGFMEINNLWKAENWKPGELLDLYKAAGAKYFMALASHCDNFDAYDSKFMDWNATKVGPKKDIVGIWAKEARARGLKFAVSQHAAHAWHWMQVAYAYDPEGPRAGQRYDGYRLRLADGAGKWWQGLDPQELYGGPVMVMPEGLTTIAAANKWHDENDGPFPEAPPAANPAFTRQFYLRTKDLIDSYHPDLVYFDNGDLPLGQVGLDLASHYYNAGLKWHGGKQEVVVTIKLVPEDHKSAVVEDVERGNRSGIEPHPFQTDTCLGDWHYNRQRFIDKSYVPARDVIHRLCDVVAKNGNLMLSVPVRGDGTIDDEERRIVGEIGEWNRRYGEAIFGTRPWKIAGEGPTEVVSGQFINGDPKLDFTAQDIRFTRKRRALYAITLGEAAGQITIASLAATAETGQGTVRRVEAVDTGARLAFTRDETGLHIDIPQGASHPFGMAVKITGQGLL